MEKNLIYEGVDIKMDYDYRAEMYNDIKNYITLENIDLSKYDSIEEANDELYDILFEESSITGNGPNDYYASQYACESYLCHNFDLVNEACRNFDVSGTVLLEHLKKEDLPEFFDCTIRCYLLGEVLGEVLNGYFS